MGGGHDRRRGADRNCVRFLGNLTRTQDGVRTDAHGQVDCFRIWLDAKLCGQDPAAGLVLGDRLAAAATVGQ